MRRSGKTTRAVDQAIQTLFRYKKLVISEVYDERSDCLDPDANEHPEAQLYFIQSILKRLESEHKGAYEIVKRNGNLIEIYSL